MVLNIEHIPQVIPDAVVFDDVLISLYLNKVGFLLFGFTDVDFYLCRLYMIAFPYHSH